MTTYWLLGEKNLEANNEAGGLGSGTENTDVQNSAQLEQLLSQQANAPSITRELVQDTTCTSLVNPVSSTVYESHPNFEDVSGVGQFAVHLPHMALDDFHPATGS